MYSEMKSASIQMESITSGCHTTETGTVRVTLMASLASARSKTEKWVPGISDDNVVKHF